jgi:hypothetical protein
MLVDDFHSSHFTLSYLSPIVLSTIKSPRQKCVVLPISWPNIFVEKIDINKWLEDCKWISSFIH